jgi:hypothetical protein
MDIGKPADQMPPIRSVPHAISPRTRGFAEFELW